MVLSNFGFDGWKMSTSRVNLDLNHILVAGRICFALSRARIRHDLQLIKLIRGEKSVYHRAHLLLYVSPKATLFSAFHFAHFFFALI